MSRRPIAHALGATVVALAATLVGAVTTTAPAAAGNACPSSDPLVSPVSGTVTAGDPDWWQFTSAHGALVTLVPTSGDPDLKIVTGSCGSTICYPFSGGTEVCPVPAGTVNVGILHFSGPGGVSGYTVSVTYPQCSDGSDNDQDGKTDYPEDPGCTGPDDDSEGVPCSTRNGMTTCAGLEPGGVVISQSLHEVEVVEGPRHDVVAHVDLYRFRLPNNTTVALHCVLLVADATSGNPCATAGGEFVTRVQSLAYAVTEPRLALGDVLLTVGVCRAELVATVNGAGITSAEAFTVCVDVEGSNEKWE